MSKVYFRYGAMHSSKSLQLLAVAHNYESQGKRVMTFKPELDTRDNEIIRTRAGFERKADIVLSRNDNNVYDYVRQFGTFNLACILVDECQFMTKDQVIAFTDVADILGIPVIAYGLKNDFRNGLFEGTEAWLAYSDKIEEIKTVCTYCNSKAIMNPRFLGDQPVFEGEQIKTGDTVESEQEYSYKPVCRKCYKMAKNGIPLINVLRHIPEIPTMLFR